MKLYKHNLLQIMQLVDFLLSRYNLKILELYCMDYTTFVSLNLNL